MAAAGEMPDSLWLPLTKSAICLEWLHCLGDNPFDHLGTAEHPKMTCWSTCDSAGRFLNVCAEVQRQERDRLLLETAGDSREKAETVYYHLCLSNGKKTLNNRVQKDAIALKPTCILKNVNVPGHEQENWHGPAPVLVWLAWFWL